MNHAVITVPPRWSPAETAARLFHLLSNLARPLRRTLREQVENTIAPRPDFGLPPSPPDIPGDDEACFELRSNSIGVMGCLIEMGRLLPPALHAGCAVEWDDLEPKAVRLTGTALRALYRDASARQCNAVRALADRDTVIAWPAFEHMERVRRLLGAALGLSIPKEAAVI